MGGGGGGGEGRGGRVVERGTRLYWEWTWKRPYCSVSGHQSVVAFYREAEGEGGGAGLKAWVQR